MKNKLKCANKILVSGLFLALLITGCQNGLLETGNGGNVTVTVDTGNNARTLSPGGISNVSAFERIEVEFTKGDASKILAIPKGSSKGTISLESGVWGINAKGFIKIDNREYEAAQGVSSVTVGTGNANVSISLETGIFDGKPGVFSYTIGLPANVSEAVLDINPLNDLHGYSSSNTGKTVDLTAYRSGSFELLPGYYLLNLTAKTGSTMAVWNELVHIYSGQKTAANHTFKAADFTGSVTLSGFVYGGELEGKRIEKAVVRVYGDPNYLNRIASYEIPALAKPADKPYYEGSWSLTVPSTLAGKQVYFLTDETIGTKTMSWGADPVTVLSAGNPDIKLKTSYAWWHWVTPDPNYGLGEDSMVFSIAADGTVTVTTSQKIENEWDRWEQQFGINYPAENGFRYAFEFEAWTDSGERNINVVYADKWAQAEEQYSKEISINNTRKTYTVVSDVRFDSKTDMSLKFFCASGTVTGTFHIKMKSIKNNWDYVAPEPEGGRWKAEPTANGIKFTVDLKGLPDYFEKPDYIEDLVIINKTNGSAFSVNLNQYRNDWGKLELPDSYQVIFPYVTAGKEYTFSLGSWNDSLAADRTVTATGGRGELGFSNKNELLLLQEGNTVKFNKTPVPSITEAKAENKRYVYEFMTGASWTEPTAQWRIGVDKNNPNEPVDLLDPDNFPGWANPAEILSLLAGKTSFATVFYTFDYTGDDIYPISSSVKGSFRTDTVSSAPFTYPSKLSGVFTAVPHPEGVKLTVDLNQIPFDVEWLQFHNQDWSASWGADPWEGEDNGGKLEIIYPFVSPGKTYVFGVEFRNSGTGAEASVTPNAGLGEVKYTNRETMGLIYNSKTKTLTFNGINRPAVQNNSKITQKYWEWQFYKGHNWDDNQWAGAIRFEEPTGSVVLDTTFKEPWITRELSEKSAFVQVMYVIEYAGRNYSFEGIISPSFMFPRFDPEGEVETGIRSAFETNGNLYIYIPNNYVSQGDNLEVYIDDYNGYYNEPVRSYAFYIDGVLKYSGAEYYAEISTSGLLSGRYYGLAVVSIDGAIFSKEFAFTVYQ